MTIYIPFVQDYRMYPAVTLQLLKKPEYTEFIIEDMKLASVCKSDKKVTNIFAN